MAITPLLNVFLNYNDTRQPVLVSAASLVPARGIQVVGGEKVTLRVYFVNTAGASPSYVVPVEADTIRLTAKKQASDEDLIYLFDEWTISGTYIETTADFATVEGFWDTATDAAKSLISNIEVETEAGLVRKWSFFTQVVRQSYGGEDPPVNPGETFVKYTAQTPTSEQQAQALANLGLSSIASAVVSDGTITSANAGKVAVVGSTTKQIGAGVAYGSASPQTILLHDGSITTANAGYLAQVSGEGNGQVEVGPPVSEDPTASAVVKRDSSGVTKQQGVSIRNSGALEGWDFSQAAVTFFKQTGEMSGFDTLSYADDLFTLYSSDSVPSVILNAATGAATFTTISAASGSFSVSSNGDMTATHGKFQGSGGQAGHIQLKQGTTPNGTANETTVWGIAGGIGWRDGTGTAYSLTLPQTGTIGVLASATEELAGTSSTVTTSPATGHVKQLYQAYHLAFSAAAFAQAVSGTGASTGTTDWGVDVTGPTTAVGYGLRRNAPTNSFAASRGKGRGVIAWGRRFEIVGTACIYAGLDAQAVFRITFGKTTGDNAGNLARRGLGFRVQGTGALEIETHNGTTRTASTNSTFTPTANQAFDFRITSDGAGNCVLWINDAQVASCTGGPTTDSSSTENAFQIEIENVSTVTTQNSATAGNFGVYMARS